MGHLQSFTKPRVDFSENKYLAESGLKVFRGIADKWGLENRDQQLLLGGISDSVYSDWKECKNLDLTHDQIERLSLILGIWKGMKLIFKEPDAALRWFGSSNQDIPFSGQSPLQTILRGSIDDLYSVRRYLDGWRGVWP